MDGIAILVLIILIASFSVLARSRIRRDDMLRRGRTDSRMDRELYRTTHTDATGVLRCRRCGAEGSERAGVCARCGAPL